MPDMPHLVLAAQEDLHFYTITFSEKQAQKWGVFNQDQENWSILFQQAEAARVAANGQRLQSFDTVFIQMQTQFSQAVQHFNQIFSQDEVGRDAVEGKRTRVHDEAHSRMQSLFDQAQSWFSKEHSLVEQSRNNALQHLKISLDAAFQTMQSQFSQVLLSHQDIFQDGLKEWRDQTQVSLPEQHSPFQWYHLHGSL